jgi:hypothetical protein
VDVNRKGKNKSIAHKRSTQRKEERAWGRGESAMENGRKGAATQLTCHADAEIREVVE